VPRQGRIKVSGGRAPNVNGGPPSGAGNVMEEFRIFFFVRTPLLEADCKAWAHAPGRSSPSILPVTVSEANGFRRILRLWTNK